MYLFIFLIIIGSVALNVYLLMSRQDLKKQIEILEEKINPLDT